ncbi:MAG: lamin tail domain-containing protein, partial [Eubacteriales bacterium]|nr:lamin tail domain-containing protein [Eubacteriales bacterium]
MALFIALLAVMYFIFPREAGKHIGSSVYDGLIISEVMAANASAVPDENGAFSDWLEIYNGTGADLNLEGVLLTNRTDRITFPFPSYEMKAGDRVIVFADNRYQLEPGMPFHGKFKISSVGTHLYLYDPSMYLIDELVTPTMTADESYIYTGLDAQGEPQYALSDFYSPGYENTQAGFTAYRNANATQTGALIINEICPDPKVGIPDEDNEIVDWLELRNTTDQPISLAGYCLSDKENKPLKWRFPDSAVIGANGFYLVYCSGKDKMQANGVPHTNFSISAERETLILSDSNGRLVDRVSIENVPADYSVGRDSVSAWQFFALTTPGSPNDANGQSKTDQLIRAYNASGVYISEVMASNDTIALGSMALTCDYLELYNSTDHTVDLSNYGLSNTLKRPRKWQFPQGVTIEPGEYKVIYLDGDTTLSSYYELHTNFKLSRAGGDTVSLCDPNGRVLDRIPLSLLPTDHSYGRSQGYAGFYYYNQPTPGAENGTGYYGYASNPAFSMDGGEYKGTVQVSMAIPSGMNVYYTLDGAIPTQDATLYNAGDVFEMTSVTVLRARAFDPGGLLQPSETVTQTYLVNVYHTLPVVSVVSDPNELWNAENGMLTVGDNVDKSQGIPFKNAVYREFGKIPREGYVEMYLQDGTRLLSQGMEFALQGQYSLDMPQKSFKVKAKARYGAKYFEASLFKDRPFTEYKCFVLRDSGNDAVWTRMNDGFQSRLIDAFNASADTPATVLHQAWNPVVVYLNGQYWGHYNMRERADRNFIAQSEGLDLSQADQMDELEASGKVVFGSSKEYKAMI